MQSSPLVCHMAPFCASALCNPFCGKLYNALNHKTMFVCNLAEAAVLSNVVHQSMCQDIVSQSSWSITI